MSQLWVSIIGKTLSPFKWVFTYGAKAFTLLVIKVVFEYNCDLSITNDFLFDGLHGVQQLSRKKNHLIFFTISLGGHFINESYNIIWGLLLPYDPHYCNRDN